jgi:uncharacterized protein (DUF58 family)
LANSSANPSSSSPFDPAVLDALAGLDFVARTVVEGFLAGEHRSPRRGSSAEFAQHREYAPGDDLRHIDWRIFARSERLVVKEYIEESNLIANIVLDTSGSMAFSGNGREGEPTWSKLDYARWVAAALGQLILGQRDIAGLILFDTESHQILPPAGGAPQRAALLKQLEAASPGGETQEGASLAQVVRHMPGRGIALVISDFLGEVEELFKGVEALISQGHEPVLLQVLHPRELDFDFDGYLRLQDLEGSGQLKVDARVLREAYLEEVAAHQAHLAKRAAAYAVDFVQMNTNQGVDVALSRYLSIRSARLTRHAGGLS